MLRFGKTIQLNLLNRNLFKDYKGAKSDEGKKEAVNFVAHSLSADTYITNSEKECKLRKTGVFFQSFRKIFII